MNEHHVPQISCVPGITDSQWDGIPSLDVNFFPWEGYFEGVRTTVKVASTEDALVLHYETDERPLRAVNTEQNSPVCQDSCMEFFFRGDDPAHYINLEINPLGTLYANMDHKPIPVDGKMLNIVSMITPEKWVLQFEVSFGLFQRYFGQLQDHLYCNFYKCGDLTVHEHYACWNPVPGDKPKFHQPEHFGKLIVKG